MAPGRCIDDFDSSSSDEHAYYKRGNGLEPVFEMSHHSSDEPLHLELSGKQGAGDSSRAPEGNVMFSTNLP